MGFSVQGATVSSLPLATDQLELNTVNSISYEYILTKKGGFPIQDNSEWGGKTEGCGVLFHKGDAGKNEFGSKGLHQNVTGVRLMAQEGQHRARIVYMNDHGIGQTVDPLTGMTDKTKHFYID